MKKGLLFFMLMASCTIGWAKEYHVAVTGSDVDEGSATTPLRTINAAAQKALPGDTITVHAGIYREWVNPLYGGTSDYQRILYRAAEGELVEIKGSELIKGWKKEKKGDGVWKVILPNSFFGNYNPYTEELFGDWFADGGRVHHTGDVYLNDCSLYEVPSVEKVINPDTIRSVRDPEGTQRVWSAVVDKENTTIYAHFGELDPNKETVEIAVRPTCFYPTRQGLNYITIRGFRVSQAATQWAAPTAEQVGMIAAHWCKGWIIENNILKNSRCNGISLGKECSTGHNVDAIDPVKQIDGSLHYIEVIFNTLRNGWSRDNIGSHIVRNNTISDCEQTGIVGSMGGAFSEIYGNHIYNIYVKRQFGGAEMGGIKLHAPVDTYIHHNVIHNVGTFGLWLDWMAQGTRVSSNTFYENWQEDMVVEVNHGPYIIDNNLFLSERAVLEYSDGGAFINNLFVGSITARGDDRFTPYHLNHSTEIKGVAAIAGGDHRYYNNLFVGRGGEKPKAGCCGGFFDYGLSSYDSAKMPITASGNLFVNGSRSLSGKEVGVVCNDSEVQYGIEEDEKGIYFHLNMNTIPFKSVKTVWVDTKKLGMTKQTALPYDCPDGSPLVFDTDFLGNTRSVTPTVGPFENLSGNTIRIKIR